MEDLKIEKRKDTLGIDFCRQSGVLSMHGTSYPENAFDFFQPIYDWLARYISEKAGPTTLNLRINYLNTSSSKCLFDVLEMLEEHHGKGGSVTVNWYYEKEDKDIRETGEELLEDLDLPYELLSC